MCFGMKILTIISGLPGSGKSTLAQAIAKQEGVICEADAYFYQGGTYKFDPDKLGDAHRYCQEKCFRNMKKGVNHIIVSNTSLSLKETKPYVDMANELGYKVQWIGILSSPFESIHKVPINTLMHMARKFSSLLLFCSNYFKEKGNLNATSDKE